ncbi:MAG: hypothetical protein R6X20_01150 [Phycisphaerae bacterium]
MPLRKKHVRRVLFAVAMAAGLGVPAGLIVYGVHVRGGAYGRAVEAALASRLRCEAAVRGARPTGLATAAADAVHLEWTAAGGRLTLDLEDVEAIRNPDGTSWTVQATGGRLALAGDDPAATLEAINQRLVQVDAALPVTYLYVQRLGLALVLEPLRVEAETRLALFPDGDRLEVHLLDPDLLHRKMTEPDFDALRPLAVMHLAPTDAGGVFAGLHADLKDLPADALRRALGLGTASGKTRGTADVTVNWHWPDADADAATVSATVRDLDLASWTAAAPGGPVEGTADLAVRYRRDGAGDKAVAVRLQAADATVTGETLRWLDGLGWPVGVPGAAPEGRVPLEHVGVGLTVADGRGQFVGAADRWGGIPLATVRLLGCEVPVLRAASGPFDAAGLWAALKNALAGETDEREGPSPPAYARAGAGGGVQVRVNTGGPEGVENGEMLN